MKLQQEIKNNAKVMYTLSVREGSNESYNESYTFRSLETLIDTVKFNLKEVYVNYEIFNGEEEFNRTSINENLTAGYGVTLALHKVANLNSSFFESLQPDYIYLVVGSEVVY